jgi:hypothetical protein
MFVIVLNKEGNLAERVPAGGLVFDVEQNAVILVDDDGDAVSLSLAGVRQVIVSQEGGGNHGEG